MTRRLVSALALLTAVVTTAALATASAKDDPAVTHGRMLFAAVGCYECHGYAGQGGAAGPRIAAIAWPYVAFSAYVRHPGREMPPYTEKVLSDADLRAIYAYVKSLPSPPPATR